MDSENENENEYEYDENTESNINESLENASNHSVSSHDSDSEVEFKSWRECLLEEDMIDIENSVFEMIDEYLQNEISTMSSPQFHANMKREITSLLYESLYDVHFSEQSSRYRADMSTSMIEICKNEDLEEVEQLVSEICDSFFENQIDIPPRSYTSTFDIPVSSEEKQTIMSTIDKLRTTFQPKQRTEEWYQFRHNIITASNIWKVFGTDCQYNSLIYEKCHPYTGVPPGQDYINTSSPMHWGNKYEPVSILIYEKMFTTHVEDFGCILHENYPFIGASPDGINTDPHSSRFGRMLEIKNIVNREIDGVPKEEYWIQMQLQMETCGLDECDFLETRFKEYASEEDFYKGTIETSSDHNFTENISSLQQASVTPNKLPSYRGVVLYFVRKIVDFSVAVSSSPHYVYMPLDVPIQKAAVDAWIQSKRDQLKSEYSLYETLFWYLEEMSCVLVKRNKEWFRHSVGKIESTWKIIEKERKDGYEHRSAKKRVPKPEVVHTSESTSQFIRNLPANNSICLIKLDETGHPNV
jgi:putative phage-type endonuclease